jgi:predicted enzyme related to lactoylglutathione lyase
MPKRKDAIYGAPCWLDLSTSDLDRAKGFYGGLFGWAPSGTGEAFGHYTNMSKDGALVAAMSPKMDPAQADVPDAWNLYFAVQDVEKASESVRNAGGTLLFDVMQVADAGSMTMFTDPTGGVSGIWQPGTHRGFGLVNQPGAPVWFELMTRDVPAAETFYGQVLDVEIADGSEDAHAMTYKTLNVDGDAHAGIFDGTGMFPDGVPPQWVIYFGVDDIDAAVRYVDANGGKVLSPPVDSSHGRWASVADPTGARFLLMQV